MVGGLGFKNKNPQRGRCKIFENLKRFRITGLVYTMNMGSARFALVFISPHTSLQSPLAQVYSNP